MNRPTPAELSPYLADLSLNWVIRPASPMPVRHIRTQASSVCSRTWLCTKTVDRSGSRPTAKSWAAAILERRRSASGW